MIMANLNTDCDFFLLCTTPDLTFAKSPPFRAISIYGSKTATVGNLYNRMSDNNHPQFIFYHHRITYTLTSNTVPHQTTVATSGNKGPTPPSNEGYCGAHRGKLPSNTGNIQAKSQGVSTIVATGYYHNMYPNPPSPLYFED